MKYIKPILCSLLLIVLVSSLKGQAGYFGKTIGIQSNFIYQKYRAHSLREVSDQLLDRASILRRFVEPAKVRVLSPEISVSFSVNPQREIILGLKQKNIPMLLMKKSAADLPEDILNLSMPYGATLINRGYTPLNSFFFQVNSYLPRQEAPIGSYASVGISVDYLSLQDKIATIRYNDEKIPLVLNTPIKKFWYSIYFGAGKKFPIAKDVILNFESRWVINLRGFTNDSNPFGSTIDIEYDEDQNQMFIDSPFHLVLQNRLGRLTLMKMNLVMGVQYMIK